MQLVEQGAMMEDRELLELAAKAAGIALLDRPEVHAFSAGLAAAHGNWSPLTDDGDALRLAVRLEMEIDICRTGIAVRTTDGRKVLEGKHAGLAATRRAIVRAAAALAVG